MMQWIALNKNHPAVFPEELVQRVLKYYSFEGDVVCDPFAGSGTLKSSPKNEAHPAFV